MSSLQDIAGSDIFKYKPITEPDGIRIAVIQPASSITAEIRCSLEYTTLSKCDYDVIDHYTALSYVWGDTSILKTIWVDDLPVQVTENLYSALRDLRDEKRELRLWVDALCINQSDDAEKDVQVGMMGKVYEAADHTIIHIPCGRILETPPDIDYAQITDVPPAIMEIIRQSSWPTRVWVFQELVLSKDPWVHCGRRRWKWNVICQANNVGIGDDSSSTIKEESEEISQAQLGLSIIQSMQTARLAHHRGDLNTIFDLVRARRGLGATDPRDVIWAYVGLMRDVKTPALSVDYGKKSITQLYNDFARYVFEINYTFDILLYVEPRKRETPIDGLASWSPDWRHGFRPYVMDVTTKEEESSSVTSFRDFHLNTRIFLKPTSFLNILACSGFKIDTVLKLSKTLHQRSFPPEIRQNLNSRFVELMTHWAKFCPMESFVFTELPKINDVDFDDALRTLYGDCIETWYSLIRDDELLERQTHFHFQRLRDFIHYLHSMAHNGIENKMFKPTRGGGVEEWLVAQFVNHCLRDSDVEGKKLALMASGVMAIVPASAQHGDFLVSGMAPGGRTSCLHSHVYKPLFLMREISVTWTLERELELKSKMKKESKGHARMKEPPCIRRPISHCSFVGAGLLFPNSNMPTTRFQAEIEKEFPFGVGSSEAQQSIYVIH